MVGIEIECLALKILSSLPFHEIEIELIWRLQKQMSDEMSGKKNIKRPKSATFFCGNSLPLTSTRWSDQHIQAFHTPRSAVDKSWQHQESIILLIYFCQKLIHGNSEKRTRGCVVRSANSASVLCCQCWTKQGPFDL